MNTNQMIQEMAKVLPFTNTREAILFGQSMNDSMVTELERGQKLYAFIALKAAKVERNWTKASMNSTMSQLCREAIEAHNGTLKLREQR